VGLAAYANLLRNANRSDDALHYETLNKQYVDNWLKNAIMYVTFKHRHTHMVTYTALYGDQYKRQYI